MQKVFDAVNVKLSDALFAEAYRATIPLLADAKHVTIRACSARIAELSHVTTDLAAVVELGTVVEETPSGLVTKTRVVAVPVTVHVKDGAEVIEDETFDKHTVSFEVNGIPEVQIVNLAISSTEAAAEKVAVDAQAKLVAVNADKALQAQIAAAREEGRKEALLEKAKQEGAASVSAPAASGKVQ